MVVATRFPSSDTFTSRRYSASNGSGLVAPLAMRTRRELVQLLPVTGPVEYARTPESETATAGSQLPTTLVPLMTATSAPATVPLFASNGTAIIVPSIRM